MTIKLELHIDEVNALLNVLGQLPNNSGTFPLAVKIKQQAEAQVPKPEEKTEE